MSASDGARPARRWLRRLAWRAFGLVRLLIAAALLWVLVVDGPARAARMTLAALPDVDYAARAETLLAAGRFADAALMAGAGLAASAAGKPERPRLEEIAARIERERAGWTRRVGDAVRGAVTGSAGEEASIEGLLGAIAADFFVVGDVRDLTIQAARAVRGEPNDPVIIALSGVGLATTLAPEIDWAPSLMKAARRAGAMTRGVQDALVRMVRAGDAGAIRRVVGDVGAIGRATSPATAARLIGHADEPADLARIARLVQREGAQGAAAIRLTGDAGVGMLRHADELRGAGKVAEAAKAETLVLRAARKGEAGGAWLKSPAARVLLRPHAVVGLAKSVWKGHAGELLERGLAWMLPRLDAHAWWLIPALAAWVFLEAAAFTKWRRTTR